MTNSVKQNRPAERPEKSQRRGKHPRQTQWIESQCLLPPKLHGEFETIAAQLNLESGTLLEIVVEAFVNLFHEDHNITLPLMLQQVEHV
jgi:hypothetical protein